MAIESLTKVDLRIAELLSESGIHRNMAKAILFLSRVPEATSTEIESAAKMRQPEVSIAMQGLRELGWVSKRDRRSKGKGRPVHIYTLSVGLDQVFAEVEAGEQAKIDAIRANLDLLRDLLKAR